MSQKSEFKLEDIIKMGHHSKPEVQDYPFPPIVHPRGFNFPKKKEGSLAPLPQQNSRFQVSPILKEILSIEEEERRAIEEKVRARVGALSDEVREKAFKVGYDEGVQKGFEDAFQKFQKEGASRIAEFEKFIAECETAKTEIFKANERFLLELIYRISKMILLKEIAHDGDYLLRLTKELIEKVGVRENIKIKLNTEDMATAEQLKEGLSKSLGNLSNLSIEVSAAVDRGGCIIETQWNAIDACIETQLSGVYEALLGEKRDK